MVRAMRVCGVVMSLMLGLLAWDAQAQEGSPAPQERPEQEAVEGGATVLEVTSTPTGAHVRVNGQLVGVTPTSLMLPSSKGIELVVEKEGFEDSVMVVKPTHKNREALHATLTPIE